MRASRAPSDDRSSRERFPDGRPISMKVEAEVVRMMTKVPIALMFTAFLVDPIGPRAAPRVYPLSRLSHRRFDAGRNPDRDFQRGGTGRKTAGGPTCQPHRFRSRHYRGVGARKLRDHREGPRLEREFPGCSAFHSAHVPSEPRRQEGIPDWWRTAHDASGAWTNQCDLQLGNRWPESDGPAGAPVGRARFQIIREIRALGQISRSIKP